MSSRRQAREAVLKALYISESRGIDISEAFGEMAAFDELVRGVPEELDAGTLKPFALNLDDRQRDFALDLARRIVESSEMLNDRIRPVLKNWDLERISRIDRYIMWIAIAEMTFLLDIPVQVSINEAIELAKRWSSEKSPRFINGVLDAVARGMKGSAGGGNAGPTTNASRPPGHGGGTTRS